MELLAGVAATLNLPGFGGDPVAFTEKSEVNVVVTRASGGASIEGKATETESGGWAFAITGKSLTSPDLLEAVWTDGDSTYVQSIEVVGGFACSLLDIEEKLGEPKRDPEELALAREVATRELEDACGVAFRTRYARAVVAGRGTRALVVPFPKLVSVLSIEEEGGEALTEEELEALNTGSGTIISTSRWHETDFTIGLIHGYEQLDLARFPVRDYAAHLLASIPSDWQGRATSFTNEFGTTYSVVTPGVRDALFALPSVNSFVNRYWFPSVAV